MVPCNMCYVPSRSSLLSTHLYYQDEGGEIKYTLMKRAQNRKLTTLYQSHDPHPLVIAETLCHRHVEIKTPPWGNMSDNLGKIFHFLAWCDLSTFGVDH